MENQFKDHDEFFRTVGDRCLHPKAWGESIYYISIEEMYQHFKARMIAESQEECDGLSTERQ